MKKIKKILIALDYDPTAQKVAETGHLFAEAMGAEVSLLHVTAEPVYYSSPVYSPVMGFTGYTDMSPIQLESVGGLKDASMNYLNKTKEHLNDKSIQVHVEGGDIAETILKTATSLHADAIVMGSHSKKWLEKILMGSVTEAVLSQSLIPLFIIPTKKQ
ncbi:MAG: universal stress protein [Bacteroidales bacterium]|jgi:nucleotide-binding universal stress UspA family protein|nr:universal stress protein [Bacteroidales bacterium]